MNVVKPNAFVRFLASPLIAAGFVYEFLRLSFSSGRTYLLLKMGVLQLAQPEEEATNGTYH